MSNPAQGSYQVIACPFAGALPQAYSASLTLTAGPPAPPPSATTSCTAPGKPLVFSMPSYVDTTRAGGEPSVVAHPDGTLLYAAHAGTTHFYSLEADDPDSEAFFENYRGQVHAYYSTDHGATWQFVDRTLPPDNAPGLGLLRPGLRDRRRRQRLPVGDQPGQRRHVQVDDLGQELQRCRTSSPRTITDRQWSAAGPADVLFLVGNPDEGGTFPTDPVGHEEHTIYRSTDGGKTFSAGVRRRRRPRRHRVRHVGEDAVRGPLRGRQAPDRRVPEGARPGGDGRADARDVDRSRPASACSRTGRRSTSTPRATSTRPGTRTATAARAAGVWYSYSTTGGRTWAAPTRVDTDDHTDIWPWIAVGDPGRVAIAWFGNDHALPGNDAEAAGANDPWNVYVAQTATGLGCRESTTAGFKVTQATPRALPYRHDLHGRNDLPGDAHRSAAGRLLHDRHRHDRGPRSRLLRHPPGWRGLAARPSCARPAARAS